MTGKGIPSLAAKGRRPHGSLRLHRDQKLKKVAQHGF